MSAWLVCSKLLAYFTFTARMLKSTHMSRPRSPVVFGCTAVLEIKRKTDLRKLFNTLKKIRCKIQLKKITNLKVCLHVVLLLPDLFIEVALSPCSDENCVRLLWAVPA